MKKIFMVREDGGSEYGDWNDDFYRKPFYQGEIKKLMEDK